MQEGAAQPRAAVDVRGLVKRFGLTVALDGIDLRIDAGESMALFGPNGAGKTTLVRCLASLSRPSAGEIQVFGLPLDDGHGEVRRRTGLVSHETFLYGSLSVTENLLFQARLFALSDPAARVADVVARVGLESRRDDPVRTLSRGLRQRCALARALLHEPDLLLLDEPFAGLDPSAADRLADELERLRDDGRTLLLTSHDLSRGARLSDRFAILHNGLLVADGAVESSDRVSEIYRQRTRA